MFNITKKRLKKTGLPPGIPIYVGEKRDEKVIISILDYDETQYQEKEAKEIEECFAFKDTPTVSWINIDGIYQVDVIEKIGKHFGLHSLIQEDIVNTEQRPKLEDFGNYIFIVLKMLYYDEKENEARTEQVSLILGENFVISFQERKGDIFVPIRKRIKNEKGRIRRVGADYLAYALLDTIVDHYFIVLEKLGDKIEGLEEKLVSESRPETLEEIHGLKKQMIFLRKSIWPLREVIHGLERGDSSLIKETLRIYLKDVYDHTVQVIDTVETFRDMLSGIHDTYLSSISNKMNEVMKVLTMIATIFIPLTFIVGIYGMNFKFMPELGWRWSYLIVWAIIVVIVVSMVIYFKKKKWL